MGKAWVRTKMTPGKKAEIGSKFTGLITNGEAPLYKVFEDKVIAEVKDAPSHSWLTKRYTKLKDAMKENRYKELSKSWHSGLYEKFNLSSEAIARIIELKTWLNPGGALTTCQALWISRLFKIKVLEDDAALWEASFAYSQYEMSCILNEQNECDTTKFDNSLADGTWKKVLRESTFQELIQLDGRTMLHFVKIEDKDGIKKKAVFALSKEKFVEPVFLGLANTLIPKLLERGVITKTDAEHVDKHDRGVTILTRKTLMAARNIGKTKDGE